MTNTNVIFDLSNIAWIARFSSLTKNEPFTRELLMYSILSMMKDISLNYKANGILVACDSSDVWRYSYFPQYKAQREETRDEFYDDVKKVMNDVADFLNTHTSIPAVSVPKAEADDIIYTATKISPYNTVVVSSDKDFVQLIDHKTKVYSPPLKGERTTMNADYDLFLKCIRGDKGDNIPSAYPRVREVVLEKAWSDKNEMLNLMETRRKIDGKKVGDVYQFNKKLIDLSQMPSEVEKEIIVELTKAANGDGYSNFNQIKVLQFLGKNNLKKLTNDLNVLSNMFKKRFLL